jgi:hypothetical protein
VVLFFITPMATASKMKLICVLFLLVPATLYSQDTFKKEIAAALKDHVMSRAAWALLQEPVTITAYPSPRSAGGIHDFYSEGDYWWPDPENPAGPYIQRDGQTNPDNFVEHRRMVTRLSKIVGALASAYILTNDRKYADHIWRHAKAWFVDPQTRMNPSLLYAQAIKGRATGRGIGIIDTIQLMEVAQGIIVVQNEPGVDKQTLETTKNWFNEYLLWLTTHPYSKDEMNATNNHGTCWVMQVASFARLTGNNELIQFCRDRYKTVLLPGQMSIDGSFPRELQRTKPYGYSIFNLDAMTMICQILSDKENDLWHYQLPDGRSIHTALDFMFPYIESKDKWPYNKDVMYWNDWPVAQPSLLFGAVKFNNRQWLSVWSRLDHDPDVEEVIRNLPIRNPLIWLNAD